MPYNTIRLIDTGRYEEAPASAQLTPGHLIEKVAGKVRKHSTAGANGQRAWAIESPLQGAAPGTVGGSPYGRTIDSPYVVDDIVSYVLFSPGDEVYAFVKAGVSYAKGDKLQSGGDGTLVKATGTNQIMAQAEEAVDLTHTGAVDSRIPVGVI